MSETTGCAISLLLTDDKSILNTPRAEDFAQSESELASLRSRGRVEREKAQNSRYGKLGFDSLFLLVGGG
jgi:hypothetical protein